MRFINATNEVYIVDVYKMDDDFTTVEYSIVEGSLEEVKEYYLFRYSNLITPHGIQISRVDKMNYDNSVWFAEYI